MTDPIVSTLNFAVSLGIIQDAVKVIDKTLAFDSTTITNHVIDRRIIASATVDEEIPLGGIATGTLLSITNLTPTVGDVVVKVNDATTPAMTFSVKQFMSIITRVAIDKVFVSNAASGAVTIEFLVAEETTV